MNKIGTIKRDNTVQRLVQRGFEEKDIQKALSLTRDQVKHAKARFKMRGDDRREAPRTTPERRLTT